MDQLDLERAIEQVEARTHGLSNLMRTRTLDKLYTQEGLYKAFADEMRAFYDNPEIFAAKFAEEK